MFVWLIDVVLWCVVVCCCLLVVVVLFRVLFVAVFISRGRLSKVRPRFYYNSLLGVGGGMLIP